MKVGIHIGEIQLKTSGGGATFQTTILHEITQSQTSHHFYIFYNNSKKLFENQKNITYLNLYRPFIPNKKRGFFKKKKTSCQEKNLLNEKVNEHKIELLWFLTPDYKFVETPFIITVWDLQHRLQPYFPEVSLSGWKFDQREHFYQESLLKASYIITGNTEGANQIEKFYNVPGNRIKTIAMSTPQFVLNTTADDKVLQKHHLVKGQYLFYPAQFWPHKNHIRILKALKILKERGHHFQIAFTGSDKGNLKYIKRKTLEFGLKNEVKFLGFVSEEELVSLYSNAFALTFASMFGPDNIPPLEAMALRCPVICSNVEGMMEQLQDCALYFNPTSEVDLAEKIQLLIQNQQLKNELIEKGVQLSKSLTPSNYLKQVIQLIDEFSKIRECWDSDEKYVHL